MNEYASVSHRRPAPVLAKAERYISRAEKSYEAAKRQAHRHGGTVTFDGETQCYIWVAPGSPLAANVESARRRSRLRILSTTVLEPLAAAAAYRGAVAFASGEPVIVQGRR